MFGGMKQQAIDLFNEGPAQERLSIRERLAVIALRMGVSTHGLHEIIELSVKEKTAVFNEYRRHLTTPSICNGEVKPARAHHLSPNGGNLGSAYTYGSQQGEIK